jgi:hypothetical protein
MPPRPRSRLEENSSWRDMPDAVSRDSQKAAPLTCSDGIDANKFDNCVISLSFKSRLCSRIIVNFTLLNMKALIGCGPLFSVG